MSRMKKIRQEISYLRFRYDFWTSSRLGWLSRTGLFSIAVIIGLIATLMSEKEIIDYKFNVMEPKADALESVARAIEQSPELWLKTIEAKKGKVSEYEYQLE